VTIRKEIATLGTAWNWARRTGLIAAPYPNTGLVYPKTNEKAPFQTRAEIERQIRRARSDEAALNALWECFFLTLSDARFFHICTCPVSGAYNSKSTE
jgi:hypothetical protein